MTTSDAIQDAASQKMRENLAKIEALTQRLIGAISQRKMANPALEGPGMDLYLSAGAAFLKEVTDNPARIFEAQVNFWGQAMKHYVEATHALSHGELKPPADPGPKDPRFTNPLWDSHPYFNFVKRQYLISAKAVEDAVSRIEGLDEVNRKRLDYFARQIIDMMAPTNFLATNPDALERAVETEGESLVKGLENLVRDIEANGGNLLVTLADRDAFKVGENIGTAEGAVVFRNRMFELIQYAPTTETVHRTPLLILPPWINKFYILDLKPANSLIRWLVDQGYTLFVVSWKNPDPGYADVGLDTYVEEGFLTAIEQVKQITGEKKINALGYCIAGTTLALTLALMAKRKDRSVQSATFLTTLTDFSDQGEFTAFLQDDFLSGIEAQVKHDGVLSSYFLSRTFSYLRANDLIYRPAIRSYMMGEAPPAFDLLYWNGDSTNLPGRMAREYLRDLCQQDLFSTKGIRILGETLKISDVKVPLTAVACETDHIAPWRASFAGIAQMGSAQKTFILSESGHIAGIVNPPGRKKYGYYTSDAAIADPDVWQAEAVRHEGSWWPRWGEWLAQRSGAMVPARIPGSADHPPLMPAPGAYVGEVVKV
ncbi:class I poly(R)-hydroxyalkanoic acid synthase [Paenirhodobacter populi]|uniref:Class I poly(R)-hydroxyalkanoic acid synthase n=1 Tax=Paenirhodobacter populi TaxID=2306993 RepID=A0A443JNW1_9RHOB|nr:class I poly(R)-hydroxyalkanoic acid synthase [Sinirhodobacter populi]RWR14350.1 class I poly(R)-hydroxyalkanoic acid synthase [Sinirhodobacter populi]RWR22190.1 class I poly(R)-hydroxyalkanoic acid synthase [Sinirhodobacter populi]